VDPTERGRLIGEIAGARGKGSSGHRHDADDFGVTRVQSPRRLYSLIERAEDHGEHGPESAMKTPDGIDENVRMLGDRRGDPWMSQLQ